MLSMQFQMNMQQRFNNIKQSNWMKVVLFQFVWFYSINLLGFWQLEFHFGWMWRLIIVLFITASWPAPPIKDVDIAMIINPCKRKGLEREVTTQTDWEQGLVLCIKHLSCMTMTKDYILPKIPSVKDSSHEIKASQ